MNKGKNTPVEIELFIKKFKGAEKVFTEGACYWFAHILKSRFKTGAIMYDPVKNHFSYRWDNGKIYDITGEVAPGTIFTWSEYCRIDRLERERIKRDCIRMDTKPEKE